MATPALPSDPTGTVEVPWPQVERFVGLFTHDLRNGLNALELQLTFLGEISDDPEAKAEVKRMRGSVADITRQLQAVRLATGTPNPRPFAYKAADLMEDFRDRFERRHGDTSARVRWEAETSSVAVEVDPELTLTALLELLVNATRHADDDSAIHVQTSGSQTGLTLSIHEKFGTPPDASPDRWGLTPLTSSQRDGYGLGAFRARRIIECQRGTLQFSYSEVDQTLTTTVVLPAATAG